MIDLECDFSTMPFHFVACLCVDVHVETSFIYMLVAGEGCICHPVVLSVVKSTCGDTLCIIPIVP